MIILFFRIALLYKTLADDHAVDNIHLRNYQLSYLYLEKKHFHFPFLLIFGTKIMLFLRRSSHLTAFYFYNHDFQRVLRFQMLSIR